jgi:dTMP kinase
MSKFIIVEGPDFCGKTTQINLLYEKNRDNDLILFTREPGSHLPCSSRECETIRKYLLNNNLTAEEEAQALASSRFVHTKEIVNILAEDEMTILCDRYIVSSLAYQGYAQGLGKNFIYELHKDTLDLLNSNNIEIHCIKFIIDQEEWNKRKQARLNIQAADSIESKNIFDKVFEFYNNNEVFNYYTKDLNMKVYNIDANKSIEEIQKDFERNVNYIIKYF